MRQVVLDTETTGLEVTKGHRVVEIGCVELVERRPTGRTFQRYLNPQRPMDRGAQEVTGLSDEFLADKPLFADVADEFLAFVRGAELIIHNASFDVGFLNAELLRLARDLPPLTAICGVVDSLLLARERFPGQRNSLDALCKRLQVDNGHRVQHGALLDAQLLADVYLSLTSGQGDLGFDMPSPAAVTAGDGQPVPLSVSATVLVRRASSHEQAAHRARLAALRKLGACLWQEDAEPTHDSESVVA